MPPLVTVATVVRNGVSLVESTLRSVLSQTYVGLEYIIIDGASTDGTTALLRRFETKVALLVSEPDEGIADAFNKAAMLAKGDAILYMNAGDEFESPESLRLLIEAVPSDMNPRHSVIYGDALLTFQGRTLKQLGDHRTLTSAKENTICHQSALIGIEVQRRFPYDKRLRVKMDLDFLLRCLAGGVPFCKIPISVCRYLIGGNSSNPQNAVRSVIEGGFVQAINRRDSFTLRTCGQLFYEALKAETKLRLRSTLGPGLYSAGKRVIGRSPV